MAETEREPLATRAPRLAVVALAAAAYLWAAPRWILGGDSGEFSTLFATGGVAHPPGYPSFVLWLRLWHWLPVASPAYGAALATAVLGVLTVYALSRACLAWGASSGATTLVTTVYALSPLTWKLASHAEVFTMNALFAATLLTLSAPTPKRTGMRNVIALALVAGFALGAHQSVVFLLPLGLLAAIRSARQDARPWSAVLVGFGLLFASFALVYSYVFVQMRLSDKSTTPMWGGGATLSDLVFLIRRGDYGTLSLSSAPVDKHPVEQVARFLVASMRHLLALPLAVLIAAPLAWRRRSLDRQKLFSVAALTLSLLIAGPLFVTTFNLPLVGAGPEVAERFYLLPEVLLTLLCALSLDVMLGSATTRSNLLRSVAGVAVMAAVWLAHGEVAEYRRPTVADYIDNTLASAPKQAFIVYTGDHRWGGFLYARYAMHLRPDVVTIDAGLLGDAWYRHLVTNETGVWLDTPSHGPVGPKTLMTRLLATTRPVLYTDWPAPAVEQTMHYSVGTLMRIVRDPSEMPSVDAVRAMNEAAFSSFELEETLPTDENGWGRPLMVDYARAWGELGQRYESVGEENEAQACFRRAQRFAPWLLSSR